MMLSTSIVTTIGLLIALPSLGLAQSMDVSECKFSQSYGGTISYDGHRDIGNGFVMYLERSVDLAEDYDGGLAVVASCASGSTLLISYDEKDLEEMQNFILAKASSAENVTLAAFQAHFEVLGRSTKLNEDRIEHCACAAFYPETKGTKKHWMMRYEHP